MCTNVIGPFDVTIEPWHSSRYLLVKISVSSNVVLEAGTLWGILVKSGAIQSVTYTVEYKDKTLMYQ